MRPDTVHLRIDDTAPCLATQQGKSLYGAFRLPDSTASFMIAVRSLPVGQGLFVPRLLLYDGTGALTREIGRDELEFRGETLTVLIRSHPGERYLVVASTPQSIGQAETRISESTRTSTSSGGGVSFAVHTGVDAAHTYVYAHDGLIWVYAATIPSRP
jgi:hypothetical protein